MQLGAAAYLWQLCGLGIMSYQNGLGGATTCRGGVGLGTATSRGS